MVRLVRRLACGRRRWADRGQCRPASAGVAGAGALLAGAGSRLGQVALRVRDHNGRAAMAGENLWPESAASWRADRGRGVPGAEDEPHDRPHGRGHRRADEVEPGNGGLVARPDRGAPAHGPQRGPHGVRQEAQPRQVDAVAGGGDDVIGGQLQPSRDVQQHLPVLLPRPRPRSGRCGPGTGPRRARAASRPRPGPSAVRRPVHPGALRQAPEQLRVVGVEPGGPARAEPGLGFPAAAGRSGRSGASGSPFQAMAGSLARTWTAAPCSCSSAADSRADWPAPTTTTSLAAERRQVGVRRAVRARRGGQVRQRRGHVGEMLHADGHDHLAGRELLAVGQGERESAGPPESGR